MRVSSSLMVVAACGVLGCGGKAAFSSVTLCTDQASDATTCPGDQSGESATAHSVLCLAELANMKGTPQLEFLRNGDSLNSMDAASTGYKGVKLHGMTRDNVTKYAGTFVDPRMDKLPAGNYTCRFSLDGDTGEASFTSTGPSDAIQNFQTCPDSDTQSTAGGTACSHSNATFGATARAWCTAVALDHRGESMTVSFSRGGTSLGSTQPVTLQGQLVPISAHLDATSGQLAAGNYTCTFSLSGGASASTSFTIQ